ncbi:hypothetical protein B7494_g3780 [Chlorociboria aeruginascens]|nr:hypothetical protein B7494_g3780 [Chlorociboria aeruginascens]
MGLTPSLNIHGTVCEKLRGEYADLIFFADVFSFLSQYNPYGYQQQMLQNGYTGGGQMYGDGWYGDGDGDDGDEMMMMRRRQQQQIQRMQQMQMMQQQNMGNSTNTFGIRPALSPNIQTAALTFTANCIQQNMGLTYPIILIGIDRMDGMLTRYNQQSQNCVMCFYNGSFNNQILGPEIMQQLQVWMYYSCQRTNYIITCQSLRAANDMNASLQLKILREASRQSFVPKEAIYRHASLQVWAPPWSYAFCNALRSGNVNPMAIANAARYLRLHLDAELEFQALYVALSYDEEYGLLHYDSDSYDSIISDLDQDADPGTALYIKTERYTGPYRGFYPGVHKPNPTCTRHPVPFPARYLSFGQATAFDAPQLNNADAEGVEVIQRCGTCKTDLQQQRKTSDTMPKRKALDDLQTRAIDGGSSLPTPVSAGVVAAKGDVNAWSGPGPAAFDFRSDTITTPTASMLAAITATTLMDDVWYEDPTTISLESYMAERTQHEASLFVLSGTMGNQLAIRSHLTQPPHSVLCDHRAHILTYEAGGIATLSSALVNGIVPSNGSYLTLEDIKKHVIISDDVHSCPTRVISLENTLGGTIMPLSVIREISAFARENGIKLHLDGARIWEAVVAGAGSLPDFTREFDSVSLCFSKGLGAPVGSILVGKKEFIKHARWVRKSIGGGLRQVGVLTAAARVAVDETFGLGPNGEGGMLKGSHVMAKRIADMWVRLGGRLERKTETNMVWLDLEQAGISAKELVEVGREKGLKFYGGRLVVHYQIGEEALLRLEEVMRVLLERGKSEEGKGNKKRKVGEKPYGT